MCIRDSLEALKSELATDATQSLQEELESLTEQLAEIELQKENLNRDIETMKSDKDVLQQKVQKMCIRDSHNSCSNNID